MDSSYKNDFKLLLGTENIREKYRYDESQIYLSTFIASFGYCNKYSAFDMVNAVQAILENNDPTKTISDKFIEALNCLNRENLKILENGVELAKIHMKRIFQQIQNFIDMNQIVACGPFLQIFLEEVKKFMKFDLKRLFLKIFHFLSGFPRQFILFPSVHFKKTRSLRFAVLFGLGKWNIYLYRNVVFRSVEPIRSILKLDRG